MLLVLTIVLSLVILVTVAGELTSDDPLSARGKVLVVATLALAWVFAQHGLRAALRAFVLYQRATAARTWPGSTSRASDQGARLLRFRLFLVHPRRRLQTSDICITSPHIRRIVTMHCVAAFIYNLGVLAMAVNILAS